LIFKEDIIYTETNTQEKEHLFRRGFSLYRGAISEEKADYYKLLCEVGKYKKAKEEILQDKHLLSLIAQTLGPDYQFQDYIWIIQKSAVHTCHRDNNGDFFNHEQRHPSYTMIVYMETMDKCLSVIPESHLSLTNHFFNFQDSLRTVLCKKGDVLLFNANLIHVGTVTTEKANNIRIQLKVTHKDDIPKIGYYENFNKVLNMDNTNPLELRILQRNASCLVPGISDMTQKENIRTSRGSDNGVTIGSLQEAFAYLFYGNKHFYDLPNAF